MVIKRFRLIGRREHRSVIIIVSGKKKGITSGILLMGFLFDTQSRIVLKFALDRLVEFGRVEFQQLDKAKLLLRKTHPDALLHFQTLCHRRAKKNGTAIGTVPILYRKWDSNPHSR